jgi:hypothetical protein
VQYNFSILDFAPICREISKSVLADLTRYGLLETNNLTRDVKRLILHHTIYCVCEVLLKRKQKPPVILYFSRDTYNTRLHEFFNKDSINEEIYFNIIKIKKMLPIRIYIATTLFEQAREIIELRTGEGVELLNNLKYYTDCHSNEKFTFSRIKQYSNRHGLTFLTKDYFNQLKTKQLLFA